MKRIPFLLLMLVLILIGSCNKTGTSDNVKTLTADNFESVTSSGVVLVDFWATWCMPCKAQSPVVDDLADQFKGKISVGKLDIDQEPALANRYGVQSIPTLLIFKDGHVVESFVGLQSKGNLMMALGKYVKLDQ